MESEKRTVYLPPSHTDLHVCLQPFRCGLSFSMQKLFLPQNNLYGFCVVIQKASFLQEIVCHYE